MVLIEVQTGAYLGEERHHPYEENLRASRDANGRKDHGRRSFQHGNAQVSQGSRRHLYNARSSVIVRDARRSRGGDLRLRMTLTAENADLEHVVGAHISGARRMRDRAQLPSSPQRSCGGMCLIRSTWALISSQHELAVDPSGEKRDGIAGRGFLSARQGPQSGRIGRGTNRRRRFGQTFMKAVLELQFGGSRCYSIGCRLRARRSIAAADPLSHNSQFRAQSDTSGPQSELLSADLAVSALQEVNPCADLVSSYSYAA